MFTQSKRRRRYYSRDMLQITNSVKYDNSKDMFVASGLVEFLFFMGIQSYSLEKLLDGAILVFESRILVIVVAQFTEIPFGICVRAIKPWPALRGCVWTGCERVRSIATSENTNER
jgi:hypothetical protein